MTVYIISAPGAHHVVIVADGGGVEKGGHCHHHRHRPDGRHRGRGAAQRQVRRPGPRDRHVPAIYTLHFNNSNVLSLFGSEKRKPIIKPV